MARKWVGFSVALVLFCAPVAAQAQDCTSLTSSRASADERGRYLVGDNPGTALVAFGCMVAAKNSYDQSGDASDAAATFAVCGAFGCGFTDSYQNCITVGTEIIYQAIRVSIAEQQMRTNGCRP